MVRRRATGQKKVLKKEDLELDVVLDRPGRATPAVASLLSP